MKKRELLDILYDHPSPIHGDKILVGLNVIQKYFSSDTKIVRACYDSNIYSVKAKKLCSAGLTLEDAKILRDAGWDISEHGIMFRSV